MKVLPALKYCSSPPHIALSLSFQSGIYRNLITDVGIFYELVCDELLAFCKRPPFAFITVLLFQEPYAMSHVILISKIY